ncbi:MAG TPA: hypothetical protein VNB94_00340 [Mycobacteriales bacterium]|nr:hypothetical protein [Mycobacteriales bacterium]
MSAPPGGRLSTEEILVGFDEDTRPDSDAAVPGPPPDAARIGSAFSPPPPAQTIVRAPLVAADDTGTQVPDGADLPVDDELPVEDEVPLDELIPPVEPIREPETASKFASLWTDDDESPEAPPDVAADRSPDSILVEPDPPQVEYAAPQTAFDTSPEESAAPEGAWDPPQVEANRAPVDDRALVDNDSAPVASDGALPEPPAGLGEHAGADSAPPAAQTETRYCEMCGMTAPVDSSGEKCHLGHSLVGGSGDRPRRRSRR